MANEKSYFVISGPNQYKYGGARRYLSRYQREEEIIELASEECGNEGTSLEELAGIEWVGVGDADEDGDFDGFEPARAFHPGEELKAAVEKLNDDGRAYWIYDDSDPKEVALFIQDAEKIGREEEAREMVSKSNDEDFIKSVERCEVENKAEEAAFEARYALDLKAREEMRMAEWAVRTERLKNWVKSLPTDTQFAEAKRCGYVAVLGSKIVGRWTESGAAHAEGSSWYGVPYVESIRRPLKSANKIFGEKITS